MKKIATRTELAKQYGVSYTTFLNWLKEIPELNLNSKKRILTPKQVALIYKHLDEP